MPRLETTVGRLLERATTRLRPVHDAVERLASRPLAAFVAVPLAWIAAVFFSVPGFTGPDPAAQRQWGRYWTSIVQIKVDHPLADMGARFEPGSNEAKRTFRITVPLVAHLTGTGVRGAFLFNHLCAFVALLRVFSLAARLTRSRAAGAYTLFLVAGTYLGTSSFKDMFGWFDATTFAFVLVAAGASHPLASVAALVCAAFTDERALALVPAALIVRHLLARTEGRPHASSRSIAAAVATIVAYAGIRTLLTFAAGIGVPPAPLEWRLLERNLWRLAPALWSPLEGGWLVFGVAGALALRGRAHLRLLLFGGYLLAYVTASLFVLDVTRSISHVCVLILALLPFLRSRLGDARLQTLLLVAAVVSLVVPNVFVWLDTDCERCLPLHLLQPR